MVVPDVTPDELKKIYEWIDAAPLSRPRHQIGRDFADGVLAAEVVAHYHPDLVDLHNYSKANSAARKKDNWDVLNKKVFRRMGFQVTKENVDEVINAVPGAVERILKLIKTKMEKYEQKKSKESAKKPERRVPSAAPSHAPSNAPSHAPSYGGGGGGEGRNRTPRAPPPPEVEVEQPSPIVDRKGRAGERLRVSPRAGDRPPIPSRGSSRNAGRYYGGGGEKESYIPKPKPKYTSKPAKREEKYNADSGYDGYDEEIPRRNRSANAKLRQKSGGGEGGYEEEFGHPPARRGNSGPEHYPQRRPPLGGGGGGGGGYDYYEGDMNRGGGGGGFLPMIEARYMRANERGGGGAPMPMPGPRVYGGGGGGGGYGPLYDPSNFAPPVVAPSSNYLDYDEGDIISRKNRVVHEIRDAFHALDARVRQLEDAVRFRAYQGY